MAFHILHKRCQECGRTNVFRRPKKLADLARILPHLPCHFCDPDALADACGGCRYPFSMVGHHSNGLCNTCAVAELRFKRALQNPPAA